jgi:hypothetical protein
MVVTARLPLASSATLVYRVMFGADLRVVMADDAASPGGAGDGVYAATIPGQSAGRLVRYRIEATWNGLTFSHPAATDSIRYEGLVIHDPSVSSNLPVIEWFMEDAVYQDLLANHRFDNVTGPAVIAFDGRVWDGAAMRIRGNTSRTRPKVSWKVEMPKGHDFDMPGRLPYPLDEFAIQRLVEPLSDLGWNTVKAGGARSLTTFPVRTQRNGQFWSVGHVMELMDGTWRDAQGVSDWAIYKGDGGSLRKTSSPSVLAATTSVGCTGCEPEPWLDKKTREDEDFTDVWTLTQNVDAPPSAAQRAWIEQNVNVPELINYMAINGVMRHADSGWYNWWVARDTEGTGRWEMWHWDLDWIFTTNEDDGDGAFLTPDTGNRFTQAILGYADYREMYFRRLRTLADQLLVPPRYENEWDGLANPYLTDWSLDRSIWGGYSPTGARNELLQGLADRRNVIAANTGPGKPVPVSQSAAPQVVINEVMYQPVGGEAAEYVELHNPSATESVDVSGWTIGGVGLTIQPGTVILPKGYAVFVKKDTTFRATYGGTGKFVAGEYPGSLDDAGETLTLTQGTRMVDQVAYSPLAPWPTAAAGTGPSLELADPSLDNSIPSSWVANTALRGTPGAANSVPTVPDTTPPSAPGTLVASNLASNRVTLSWGAATDNRAVAGYRITRNGAALAGIVTGLAYTDTALAPVTPYTYSVQAIDTSGLVGPASNTVAVTTLADTGIVFSEAWSGTEGAAWSPSWASGTAGSGTVAVRSGTGELAVPNTSGAYARSQLTGLASRADSDITFSYQWNSGTPSAYFSVFARGSGGWRNGYRPNSGYGLEFGSNSSTVTLKRTVNGTATNLSSSSGAQQVGTGRQWVRLQVVGSTIRYKTWLAGQSEPAAWRASITDAAVTAPGQLFVSLNRGSANSATKSVRLDDLTIR